MPSTEPAVMATDLRKTFRDTIALAGFDVAVSSGTVHGLLGPNGAGKTTAVRVLATLTRPDSGEARVAGFDVVREPAQVRYRIGLVGQHAAVDEKLTGRQNLEMFGRLYHLGISEAKRRAAELLDRFHLADAADRQASKYSGGMRRRLDLAAGLILAPPVLFLDEPTTGLDPRGRNEVWDAIRGLTVSGTTVLLTTQYLEEADQLADHISLLDHGTVVANGTPKQLKQRIGVDHLEVVVTDAADLPPATALVAKVADGEPETDPDRSRISAAVTDRIAALDIVRTLGDAGIGVADIELRRPTLDEVFLRLTSTPAADNNTEVVA